MGAVLAALVKAVGPMVAPFILSGLIGKGIQAYQGSKQPTIPSNAFMDPRYPGWYRQVINPSARGNRRYGAWTQIPTVKNNTALSMLGKGATGVANIASIVGPMLLNTVGRGVQAAGVAGGAAAQAVGNMPSHFANIGNSASKREVYGGSPADALGGVASDIGSAAGVGISAAGNAVGTSLSQASEVLRAMDMQRRLADVYSQMGGSMSPAQAHMNEQYIRSMGQAMRGGRP